MAWSGKDLQAFKDSVKPETLARNPQLKAYLIEIGIIAQPAELARAERATLLANQRLWEDMKLVDKYIKEYEERFGPYNA